MRGAGREEQPKAQDGNSPIETGTFRFRVLVSRFEPTELLPDFAQTRAENMERTAGSTLIDNLKDPERFANVLAAHGPRGERVVDQAFVEALREPWACGVVNNKKALKAVHTPAAHISFPDNPWRVWLEENLERFQSNPDADGLAARISRLEQRVAAKIVANKDAQEARKADFKAAEAAEAARIESERR